LAHLKDLTDLQGTGDYSVGNVGCAITSLSMALNNLGLTELSPGQLVQVLDAQGGFTPIQSITGTRSNGIPTFDGANVNWPGLKQIFPTLGVQRYTGTGSSLANQILLALAANDQVLVNVKGGAHWVLAVSVSGNTLDTIDPGSALDGSGNLVTSTQPYALDSNIKAIVVLSSAV